MRATSSRFSKFPLCRISNLALFFIIPLVAVFATGCGSGTTMPSPPHTPALSGNTSVTLLLSSTANDQLSQFNVAFASISLTNNAGKSVSLLSTQQNPEFIHLDGTAEPLVTVSVPQDVYTAATVTTGGSATFVCVSQVSSGGIQTLQISEFGGGAQPVTVNLASPITITGTAMGLLLDLQVPQSVTFSSCDLTQATFTITPTFNLTPFAISPQPTNVQNGKTSGIDGQISSITTGRGFDLVTADGMMLSANTSGSTVYQGVGGLSALVAGMAVDIDAAIQPDGSLLATRVAVEDADPTNLSLWTGPVLNVAASVPVLANNGREQQGYLLQDHRGGGFYFSFGTAAFKTSGQFTNLQNLPFAASLNGSNMVAGQNVYITSHALTMSPGPIYVPAATVTLLPQTINGAVTAVGNEGAFATYTVTLAPYDLFPQLAVQPGQTTLLSNPNEVVVYVDSNTQQLNTMPLSVGSVLRFNGLLFNDNGTLRMDCGQVNDGVTE
jgi:hypothetical protein